MGLRKDIWRPAIVAAPIEQIVARGSIDGLPLTWLPPMGSFRFLADPFGFWRDDKLHVFVEAYDYRVRVGMIEVLTYDRDLTLLDRQPALAEPWHLSYPFVFEADGDIWMLPEAHRSGGLTLYRATDFPTRWEPTARRALDHVAVDATPLFHNGLWWLLYASADDEVSKTGALFAAWAETLTGPWTPHPLNPVRHGIASTRPGGTPALIDGRLMLPVQDCSRTYGGAIRPLWIDTLTPTAFYAEAGPAILPPVTSPLVEGCHTLAAAGPVTLVDVKRTELSLHGLTIEAIREGRKLLRRR